MTVSDGDVATLWQEMVNEMAQIKAAFRRTVDDIVDTTCRPHSGGSADGGGRVGGHPGISTTGASLPGHGLSSTALLGQPPGSLVAGVPGPLGQPPGSLAAGVPGPVGQPPGSLVARVPSFAGGHAGVGTLVQPFGGPTVGASNPVSPPPQRPMPRTACAGSG